MVRQILNKILFVRGRDVIMDKAVEGERISLFQLMQSRNYDKFAPKARKNFLGGYF